MSAPIQGFAEHTIWHEIIMFQLCCEERSWPLILASVPLCLSILPSCSFREHGKPQQRTLNSATLSLPFIRTLFNREEAFIISIPLNNDFSYFGSCNLMAVITCCCGRKIKVSENAESRHLSHTKDLKALMNLNEKDEAFCNVLILELNKNKNGWKRNRLWGDAGATAALGKLVVNYLNAASGEIHHRKITKNLDASKKSHMRRHTLRQSRGAGWLS